MADPSALGLNRRDLGAREGRPSRSPTLGHYHPWREANIRAHLAAVLPKAC
jgi:hypothetical protein